jgi:hypothetical protein
LSLVPSIPRPIDGPPFPNAHFGLAVARGQVTQPATDEVIVVADNSVHVLSPTGGQIAATDCMLSPAKTPPDLYRALAVADFLAGGNQEIALGLPVLGGRGQVVMLRYGLNPAKPADPVALFCGPSLVMPEPAGEMAISGFGTSLVAVPDMNGDGLAELVVGAPPDRAYLFYSPFNGSTPPKFFIKGDSKSEFGQRVALVDIDGDGVKELAITALQANVGSTPKAGQVLVYKLDGDGTTPIAVLNDSHPTANKEFFGIGLAELEFNSARTCAKGKDAHVLVAGADAGLFTFFRFVGGAPDPRCFAQK